MCSFLPYLPWLPRLPLPPLLQRESHRRSSAQPFSSRLTALSFVGWADLAADLATFVQDHPAHGQFVGDASEPGPSGYRVTIACPCGVTFERWVTGLDAAADLLRLELRAMWN